MTLASTEPQDSSPSGDSRDERPTDHRPDSDRSPEPVGEVVREGGDAARSVDPGRRHGPTRQADLVRQEVLATCRLCVVKVGTRCLTDASGHLELSQIASLADQIAALRARGVQVVLVSSGAVGAGVGELGLPKRPSDVASLQAVAAVGQARLMNHYNDAFGRHGLKTGQVLLTAGDLDDRTRYLNVRNTLLRLLEFGAVPIVNENDTVAVDELAARFGDNDRLAALVASLLRASVLVILSDVAGLYDGDPQSPTSRVLPLVREVDDATFDLVRDRLTGLSRGGMASKLKAARMVTLAGENAIVASGRETRTLLRLFDGETLGTLFIAHGKSISPRKRWIGFSAQAKGELVLDDGAIAAIARKGRSLLATGVRRVKGTFAKGDVVLMVDGAERQIARGLSNYSSDDLQRIRGLSSREFGDILGHVPYEEVIHRDNLMVLDPPAGSG
ncbi:MAG TPA: glutamate 5-kinase [Pirellulaceae bacterium]|nr:glutamate 5-kinase [Pirellulaceae bacterium]